jgi:hypothetical protein
MRITNKYNLPEVFVRFAEANNYPPREGVISVSDLINPPLMRTLKKENWDRLESDASEYLWLLLGTAIHYVLEKHSPEELLTEHHLEFDFGDVKITGRADVYDDEKKEIHDYKVVSVYSFLLGEKLEWERQLNVYAYLFRKMGNDTKDLKIIAILRDWIKRKAIEEADYPKIPFLTKQVPLWSPEEQEKYVQERLQLFSLPPTECSLEDKWQKPTTWAIMQDGRKKAVAVIREKEKLDNIMLLPHQHIEERVGKPLRCLEYCICRGVCPYAPKQGGEDVGDDEDVTTLG